MERKRKKETAKMKYLFITFLFLLFFVFQSRAQVLEGIVVSESNVAIIGANVIDLSTKQGTATDIDGRFELKLDGANFIVISALGYQIDTIFIDFSQGNTPRTFTLNENVNLLNEIVVKAKSASTLVREEAYAVEVIESKEFKNLSTNANSILSRISGVNIRESGGLGSQFSLSLNGLSGNQVRIFLNGVPMDYFGTSLSLNNFAANIIERIEVYKGVVPVHLSSDALGGAINVVTSSNLSSYLDASYSFGSFNTHIATFNAQRRGRKSGWTHRIKSFFNQSDNNYEVPVQLVDFETGKQDDFETWVERFHDGYQSKMLWYETGITGKPFADEFMIGALYSDNYKELQQAANAIGQAKIPYGEVSTEEQKWIGNITYTKTGLFNDRLSISAYGVAVFSETLSRDTASVRYDWFGVPSPKLNNTTGEIENRKTLLTLESENYLANINGEFAITDQQSITLNYSLNDFGLQGGDPFKDQNNTQFSQPNEVRKQVLAGSFTNTFWSEKIKITAFSKYYDYKVNSLETNYSGTEIIPFENKKDYLGWGATSSILLGDFQLKMSFEKAIRFPEIVELFGDGLNIVSSPTLLPENSNNFNLGLLIKKTINSNQLFVSFNTFLRSAKDFIIPVVQGLKVFHINNNNVLSKGVDIALGLNIRENFVLSLNGTYLDLRDNNVWRNGVAGVENNLYKARIPNVPYLFGNLSFSYRKENLLKADDSYSISINQNYVHEFFYRWEVLASINKSVVPSQFSTNLDMVYSMNDEKYNISFSVVNLFDSRLYDNFQQLRPGRNFNVKLRYFLN